MARKPSFKKDVENILSAFEIAYDLYKKYCPYSPFGNNQEIFSLHHDMLYGIADDESEHHLWSSYSFISAHAKMQLRLCQDGALKSFERIQDKMDAATGGGYLKISISLSKDKMYIISDERMDCEIYKSQDPKYIVKYLVNLLLALDLSSKIDMTNLREWKFDNSHKTIIARDEKSGLLQAMALEGTQILSFFKNHTRLPSSMKLLEVVKTNLAFEELSRKIQDMAQNKR